MQLAQIVYFQRLPQELAPQTFQRERSQRSPASVRNRLESQPVLWKHWLREFVPAHARHVCRRHLVALLAQIGMFDFRNFPWLAPEQRLSAISVFPATTRE